MVRAFYAAYSVWVAQLVITEFSVTGPLPATQKATQPSMKNLTFGEGLEQQPRINDADSHSAICCTRLRGIAL